MASLSPEYILHDKTEDSRNNNSRALHVALLSLIGGSFHPLSMADSRDAGKRPVMFIKFGYS